MLGKKKFEPKMMYNLTIDDLVPEDNIYRQIDQFLNLRFVYKECEKLYGKTGKPSLDPVVFFKLELFGYLENIISDRELIRKAGDSLAARYFIGYDIDEKLPWHSTISRTRGLISKETFENIFSKILELCYQAGLIEGKHQSIDSTLVKANASLDSLERKEPKLSIKEYIDKTYAENKEEEQFVSAGKEDVEQGGGDNQKSELRIETASEQCDKKKPTSNRDYESKTDPDSRIATKPGKPSGLYYSTHYSADCKKRIITDVYTTYADRRDSVVLLEVYKRVERRLSELRFIIEEISADKGFCSGKNLRELEQRGVEAFIPTQRYDNKKGVITNKEFIYEEEKDVFICPNHKELTFSFYDKKDQVKRYIAREKDCLGCPLKEKCCPKGKRRSLSRTIYYKEYQRLEQRLKTPAGRRAIRIRKVVSEGLFAEAKMYNGLRKFMTKGIEKAQKRSYMIASVQNLKRLLRDMKRKVRIAVQKVGDIIIEPFLLNKFMFVLIIKNNSRVN